eukprot:TRINITY_DN50824_c0_g1_i1.p1 TRINITY_DN50824_c0_g1~~TRINITY_DN50824_c0_g1_i1.p1  ORF type:complete len:434 (+),score=67.17 TRINITY_DN50824_c0_g1_i1:67-1368(+)
MASAQGASKNAEVSEDEVSAGVSSPVPCQNHPEMVGESGSSHDAAVRVSASSGGILGVLNGMARLRRNVKETSTTAAATVADVDQRLGISESSVVKFLSNQVSGLNEKKDSSSRVSSMLSKKSEIMHQASLALNKAVVSTAASLPIRSLVPQLSGLTLCYFDANMYPRVADQVALTIDDAPCRSREQERSMIGEVNALLAEYDAKATFFLCTDYVAGFEDAIHALLRDGHEVANHGASDRSYGGDSEEAFEMVYLESERICDDLRRAAGRETSPMTSARELEANVSTNVSTDKPGSSFPEGSCAGAGDQDAGADAVRSAAMSLPAKPYRWFRAPHADLSEGMEKVLIKHGATNVLCDCFANDTIISDADFLAKTLVSLAVGGSILVIHMPEKGFREHNFAALRGVLQGLRARNMRVTTVSALTDVARQEVAQT